MDKIQVNFSLDPEFKTNEVEYSETCLAKFPNWFRGRECPDIFYYRPNFDLECLPQHVHFFRAMSKMWFFNQYLTEKNIKNYIKTSVWKFDSRKISCVRFYAMVCVLRYPTESIENPMNQSLNLDTPFPWEKLEEMKPVDVLQLVQRNCEYENYHWMMPSIGGFPVLNRPGNFKFGSLIQENPERILKNHIDFLFRNIDWSYKKYFSANNTSDEPSLCLK